MKKLFAVMACLLIIAGQAYAGNKKQARWVYVLDGENSLNKTICVAGYVFVKHAGLTPRNVVRLTTMTQIFGLSPNGMNSIPLTCKKYLENRKKMIKANKEIIDLR